MRTVFALLVSLFAMFGTLSSSQAKAPSVVVCEADKWQGSTVSFDWDRELSVGADSVNLPRTIYELSHDYKTAYVYDGKKKTAALVVNTYRKYVVLSYVYGGVHYTDTLYDSGFVFSQLSKTSLALQPLATIFYKQCEVVK